MNLLHNHKPFLELHCVYMALSISGLIFVKPLQYEISLLVHKHWCSVEAAKLEDVFITYGNYSSPYHLQSRKKNKFFLFSCIFLQKHIYIINKNTLHKNLLVLH